MESLLPQFSQEGRNLSPPSIKKRKINAQSNLPDVCQSFNKVIDDKSKKRRNGYKGVAKKEEENGENENESEMVNFLPAVKLILVPQELYHDCKVSGRTSNTIVHVSNKSVGFPLIIGNYRDKFYRISAPWPEKYSDFFSRKESEETLFFEYELYRSSYDEYEFHLIGKYDGFEDKASADAVKNGGIFQSFKRKNEELHNPQFNHNRLNDDKIFTFDFVLNFQCITNKRKRNIRFYILKVNVFFYFDHNQNKALKKFQKPIRDMQRIYAFKTGMLFKKVSYGGTLEKNKIPLKNVNLLYDDDVVASLEEESRNSLGVNGENGKRIVKVRRRKSQLKIHYVESDHDKEEEEKEKEKEEMVQIPFEYEKYGNFDILPKDEELIELNDNNIQYESLENMDETYDNDPKDEFDFF